MAEHALALLFTVGFSNLWTLGPVEPTLPGPYPGWDENFLPRVQEATPSVETSGYHANVLGGLSPSWRVGRLTLDVPLELAWLSWRTDEVRFDWYVREGDPLSTLTDTLVYRFDNPGAGLALGWIAGERARIYLEGGVKRWERVHWTWTSDIDPLGTISVVHLSEQIRGRGLAAELELGVDARERIRGDTRTLGLTRSAFAALQCTWLSDGAWLVGARLGVGWGPDVLLRRAPTKRETPAERAVIEKR